MHEWSELLGWFKSRRGLLDAVVFSGGEPLIEPLLGEMMEDARSLGFQIGLHTAGIYPERLEKVLPLLDWVGLDVKASGAEYEAVTQRAKSYEKMSASLELLLQSSCDLECRTTWSPSWQTEESLVQEARELARRGVKSYALQRYRASASELPEAALSATSRSLLEQLFPVFEYR